MDEQELLRTVPIFSEPTDGDVASLGRLASRRASPRTPIGTTRETVTRMPKDLEREGLIHIEGKEIVVEPDFEKVFD